MDREEINNELKILEDQIKHSYYKTSIVEGVCKIQDVSSSTDYGKYHQFAKRIRIKKEIITDPNSSISLDCIGSSVAFGEINYLIETLSNFKKLEIDTFSIEKIHEKILEMKSKGLSPDMIFIPIEYYSEIHNWNKDHKPYGSEGSMFNRLFLNNDTNIKIQYSNIKIELKDIMILCRESNQWNYRLDEETGGRITVKIDWDVQDEEDAVLLVRTIFQFIPKNENCIIKIKDFKKREK